MTAFHSCSGDENPEDARKAMRDMFGPQAVDQAIRQAISTCWIVGQDGNVRPQSVLWLFCWATTGQSSQRAAREAREVFDRIFDRPYESLSRRITLEYARERRYAGFDIEEELQDLLHNSE